MIDMPALGRKSRARLEKGKGPLSGENCIKKAGHSVPKEPYTIKRNQTTVVGVVYKLLIAGDSAHTSGFAVCQAARRHVGSCPPAQAVLGGTRHPPQNTGPTAPAPRPG